jgi:hypothetical protein
MRPRAALAFAIELLEAVDDEDFALHAFAWSRRCRRGRASPSRGAQARRSRRSPAREPISGTITRSARRFSSPSRVISATAHWIGALERRRAAEAMADRVGEDGEAIPGESAAERFADQPGGGLAIRLEPSGRLVSDVGTAHHEW